MSDKPQPLPQTGGSFTRTTKGALKQVETPTAPRPTRTAEPAAQPEPKEA